jgi:hypothetical protein
MSLFEMVEELIRECKRHNGDAGHYTQPQFLKQVEDKLEECKKLWKIAEGLKDERQ